MRGARPFQHIFINITTYNARIGGIVNLFRKVASSPSTAQLCAEITSNQNEHGPFARLMGVREPPFREINEQISALKEKICCMRREEVALELKELRMLAGSKKAEERRILFRTVSPGYVGGVVAFIPPIFLGPEGATYEQRLHAWGKIVGQAVKDAVKSLPEELRLVPLYAFCVSAVAYSSTLVGVSMYYKVRSAILNIKLSIIEKRTGIGRDAEAEALE